MNILVVDDHSLSRRMLSALVQSMPYTIIEAHSSHEAMDILAHTEVHVLVTDFEMPTINGIDLFKFARAKQPYVRGILCTASLFYSSLSSYVEIGLDDCLPKSKCRDLLLPSVERSINQYEQWQGRMKMFQSSTDVRLE